MISRVLEKITRKITEIETMHKEGKRRRGYSPERTALVMSQLESLYWCQGIIDEAIGYVEAEDD